MASTSFVTAEAEPLVARPYSQWNDIRRRFIRNKLAVVGLAMLTIVVLVGIFAPLLAPYDPLEQDLTNTQASPSRHHWFGTDQIGRDQLSRVMYGTRIALMVGLAVVLAALVVGVVVGAVAGYLGHAWDSVLMRVADFFLAFPLLIGAILITTVLGNRTLVVVIGALAVFSWATVARLMRSSVLAAREAEYVEAARSLGASRWRIVTRHILPNSLAPVLIYAAVSIPGAIVAEAALTFLGVGLKPGQPDWGQMISDGQKFFGYKDFLWLYPSLALVFTTLGFVFVADGLRDALDPKLRGS
jgi:ABC-type dipeptide/oligopeptide/nickel transport system permease subunit